MIADEGENYARSEAKILRSGSEHGALRVLSSGEERQRDQRRNRDLRRVRVGSGGSRHEREAEPLGARGGVDRIGSGIARRGCVAIELHSKCPITPAHGEEAAILVDLGAMVLRLARPDDVAARARAVVDILSGWRWFMRKGS